MRCNHIEHTLVLFPCEMFHYLGVSISTNDRRNVSVVLLREVGYFSPRKKKQPVLMMLQTNKISQNLNENVKTHWF